jgi:hypothetical protein
MIKTTPQEILSPTPATSPAWDEKLLQSPHTVADKRRRVQQMFAAIAPSYDLNNRLHSLWMDQLWRRKAVKLAALNPNDRVVDVACGTGDLTWKFFYALFHRTQQGYEVPSRGQTIGIDFTFEMLPIATRKMAKTTRDFAKRVNSEDPARRRPIPPPPRPIRRRRLHRLRHPQCSGCPHRHQRIPSRPPPRRPPDHSRILLAHQPRDARPIQFLLPQNPPPHRHAHQRRQNRRLQISPRKRQYLHRPPTNDRHDDHRRLQGRPAIPHDLRRLRLLPRVQNVTAIVPPSSAAEMAKWALWIGGIITLIGGATWTVWIILAVRRDVVRHRGGLCMKCGYDLRHSGDRCPECGEPKQRI